MTSKEGPKRQNVAYIELHRGIFVLSKYLGLLPVDEVKGKLSISMFKVILSLAVWFCFCTIVIAKETLRTIINYNQSLSFAYRIFCFYGVLTAGCLIKPLTIFHIILNLNKFSRAVETISEVDRIIGVSMSRVAWKRNLFVFMTINCVSILYEMIVFFNTVKESPSIILIYEAIIDIFLVVHQFTVFIGLSQERFEYLCETLNEVTAERWCLCQELLCSFNKDVNCCYAPQLLLVILSFILYFVSRTYVIIKTESVALRIDLLYWILINFLFIWYICDKCRDTVQMAKEFDDRLYELIIKDKSRLLLKNKRIMLHFRVKYVEDISALGYFRFDFPLLCSIFSSAISYVMVMIQFS